MKELKDRELVGHDQSAASVESGEGIERDRVRRDRVRYSDRGIR